MGKSDIVFIITVVLFFIFGFGKLSSLNAIHKIFNTLPVTILLYIDVVVLFFSGIISIGPSGPNEERLKKNSFR